MVSIELAATIGLGIGVGLRVSMGGRKIMRKGYGSWFREHERVLWMRHRKIMIFFMVGLGTIISLTVIFDDVEGNLFEFGVSFATKRVDIGVKKIQVIVMLKRYIGDVKNMAAL